MIETKKIWDLTYVKCYWPNSVRYEEEDEDKAYYNIYINNEFVESAPLCATRQEAEMRFHELLEERGIEDDSQYERKLLNQ